MQTIYRIDFKFKNAERIHSDLWGDYNEALGWFNGVKCNQECVSMEMTKLQTDEDCSFFKENGIVASYNAEIEYYQRIQGSMRKESWNPDLDYKDEYAKVYFRIKTPTYKYSNGNAVGFITQEDEDGWHKESSNLIKSLGIKEDCGSDIYRSKEKYSYLYPHPQEISGVVLKNDIKRIAKEISKMQTSSLCYVDIYETVYKMSDDEYKEYLNRRKNEIRKLILEYISSEKNKKIMLLDVNCEIACKVELHRLGYYDSNYFGGVTLDYVRNVIMEMVNEGYLQYTIDGRNKVAYIKIPLKRKSNM